MADPLDQQAIHDPSGETHTPAPDPARGWKLLSGLLFVAWMALFIYHIVLLGQASAQRVKEMSVLKEAHFREQQAALEHKAITLARALQLASPALITEEGQRLAQHYFADLLSDRQLAFIAFYDETGTVCATTDLRLMRDTAPAIPKRAHRLSTATHEADIEVIGPITTADGKVLGVVRIGLAYGFSKEAALTPPAHGK
jgi:hypothetical protein